MEVDKKVTSQPEKENDQLNKEDNPETSAPNDTKENHEPSPENVNPEDSERLHTNEEDSLNISTAKNEKKRDSSKSKENPAHEDSIGGNKVTEENKVTEVNKVTEATKIETNKPATELDNEIENNKKKLDEQKELISHLSTEIKSHQDHIIELKRTIDTRQKLLVELRQIGEGSKQKTPEHYFHMMNNLNDEIQLKDKQLAVQLQKIKDLENLLGVARAQPNESNKLTIRLRGKDEEIDHITKNFESAKRSWAQEKENSDFKLKNLENENDNLHEENKKLLEEIANFGKKNEELEKSNDQLVKKIEDLAHQNEKNLGQTKDETGKSEKLRDEIDMLRLLLDSEKKKVRDLNEEYEKSMKDKRLLDAENKEFTVSNKKLRDEMTHLLEEDKQQRSVLEIQNSENRETIHQQREKINNLEAELLEFQRRKDDDTLQIENDKLKEDNNNLIDELRQNMEDLMKLEELEELKPELKKKTEDIEDLQKEVEFLKNKLDENHVKSDFDDERIGNLQDGLYKAGGRVEKMKDSIAHLTEEKKELSNIIKKKDLQLKDKDQNIQKTLDSLEDVKKTGKKLRSQVEKLLKEKEEVGRKMERLINDFTLMKRNKEEMQNVYGKMSEEYNTFKDTIAKKDEWIIKQGNEMKIVLDQYTMLKKKFSEFKVNIELDYGKTINEKNTEITVLKEMIKSAQSMVKAKEVDISRLKRKLQTNDFNPNNGASEDERTMLGSKMSQSMIKKVRGGKNSIIMKTQSNSRPGSLLKNQIEIKKKNGYHHENPETSGDEDEKPLIKSIDNQKGVTVKKNYNDVKRMMDEDDERRGIVNDRIDEEASEDKSATQQLKDNYERNDSEPSKDEPPVIDPNSKNDYDRYLIEKGNVKPSKFKENTNPATENNDEEQFSEDDNDLREEDDDANDKSEDQYDNDD